MRCLVCERQLEDAVCSECAIGLHKLRKPVELLKYLREKRGGKDADQG